jgi:hydrogenase nickel incorporation protein HypA/HybF
MHELSIAVSLIDAACDELDRLNADPASDPSTPTRTTRVVALRMRLGPLSGVVKDALLFSFDLAAEGTPIAGARLDIDEVPVVVFCAQCAARRELPSIQSFRCPVCDQPTPNVVAGREMELRSMEVTTDVDADH